MTLEVLILVAGLWEADQVVDNQRVGDNSDSGSRREAIVSDFGDIDHYSYNFSHSYTPQIFERKILWSQNFGF